MGLRRIFREYRKGRNSSSQYDRKKFLDSIPKDLKILEIGPFFNPSHKGGNVKYFDIESQEDLIKKAKEVAPVYNEEDIPFIDYVSPEADLTIIDETFDAIFSSHVIEHQFDLIDHLQKSSKLLPHGGSYYLVIPDKRYCFDHYQQLSTIADVVSAHYEKRKRHVLKSLIEHNVFITHNDPVQHWKGNHGQLTGKAKSVKKAIADYENKEVIDTHAFFFTPDSFLEIMDLLLELGYIDFRVERVHQTPVDNLEFFCVLEKTGAK